MSGIGTYAPHMKKLIETVALVAGATRGAGRGIARMLGEAGATVYCTGRSSRTHPNASTHHYAGRPETIEETAELVTAAGGEGVAVHVDHHVENEVAALCDRIDRERGRLDVLVNVITGEPVHQMDGSFAGMSPAEGRRFFDSWIWTHVVTAWHAVRVMRPNRRGLLVELVEQDGVGYHGQIYLDLMEIALKRLSLGLAHDLKTDGIAAVCVAPGFMRTEAILQGFGVTEANWRDALHTEESRRFGWGGSETPCFTGRAVAALAADPKVAAKSGGIFTTWELSKEYGFTDVDGRLPEKQVLQEAIRAYYAHVPKGPNYQWSVSNQPNGVSVT